VPRIHHFRDCRHVKQNRKNGAALALRCSGPIRSPVSASRPVVAVRRGFHRQRGGQLGKSNGLAPDLHLARRKAHLIRTFLSDSSSARWSAYLPVADCVGSAALHRHARSGSVPRRRRRGELVLALLPRLSVALILTADNSTPNATCRKPERPFGKKAWPISVPPWFRWIDPILIPHAPAPPPD